MDTTFTLARRIERPLTAVLERKLVEFAEARHHPQFLRLVRSPTRLTRLAEMVAGMLHAHSGAGKRATRPPSDEELGVSVALLWPDIRPLAIVLGTRGDDE
jgi:hypothetical protein